jgi:hypothetical protein
VRVSIADEKLICGLEVNRGVCLNATCTRNVKFTLLQPWVLCRFCFCDLLQVNSVKRKIATVPSHGRTVVFNSR